MKKVLIEKKKNINIFFEDLMFFGDGQVIIKDFDINI